MLNGFDGNGQEVVHESNLLLQEGLAVCDAAQRPIETSHGVYARPNFGLSREQILAGFLITELRLVGHDRREFTFELLTDIHDEAWPNVVVQRRVNNFERTMRLGSSGILPAVDRAARPR